MISAGEVHLPGRPKDIVGLKALAIAVNHSYANVRPGGVKVRAGAPILELGMVEADFAEMAAAGVRLIGEIGLGSVKSGADAAPMVAWGRAHGMVSTYHTGGPSLAGSGAIGGRRGPRGEPAHRRPHQRRHDVPVRARHRPARRERLGHRAGARPLRQRPDGARRARARPRRPARSTGSSSATTRRPGPASSRSGSCGSWPTWRRSAGSRRRPSCAWRPATRPGSTASTSGVLAPGQRRGPVHRGRAGRLGRGHGARARWRTATSSGSRWSSSTARRSSAAAATRRRPAGPPRSSRDPPSAEEGTDAVRPAAAQLRARARTRPAWPRWAPTCAAPRTSASRARCSSTTCSWRRRPTGRPGSSRSRCCPRWPA